MNILVTIYSPYQTQIKNFELSLETYFLYVYVVKPQKRQKKNVRNNLEQRSSTFESKWQNQ